MKVFCTIFSLFLFNNAYAWFGFDKKKENVIIDFDEPKSHQPYLEIREEYNTINIFYHHRDLYLPVQNVQADDSIVQCLNSAIELSQSTNINVYHLPVSIISEGVESHYELHSHYSQEIEHVHVKFATEMQMLHFLMMFSYYIQEKCSSDLGLTELTHKIDVDILKDRYDYTNRSILEAIR